MLMTLSDLWSIKCVSYMMYEVIYNSRGRRQTSAIIQVNCYASHFLPLIAIWRLTFPLQSAYPAPRPPVFKVENQRWGNCTSAFGLQTGCFGPWSLFMKFEVWERWIAIIWGAGTAFPCVQWHFKHCRPLATHSPMCPDYFIDFGAVKVF